MVKFPVELKSADVLRMMCDTEGDQGLCLNEGCSFSWMLALVLLCVIDAFRFVHDEECLLGIDWLGCEI